MLAATAARLRGVPLIFRPVGDPWQEYKDYLQQGRIGPRKARVGCWMANRIVAQSGIVSPVSASLATVVAERTNCPQRKLRPVPIPVDGAVFHPAEDKGAAKRKLGYEDDCVITLASIFDYEDKIRGIVEHLPLLRRVVERFDNASVVIAGDGGLRRDFERRYQDVLDHPRLHMAGWVANMPELYRASDICCHFSYFDACPNVLLEAWACGLPVVVNDFEPLLERVDPGVNGCVLPADGTQDEALEQLASLITDRQARERMGRNGREMVLADFSRERIGRDMLSTIEAVSASGGRVTGTNAQDTGAGD